MSSERLSRMTSGKKMALNNVSELFLYKASEDIVAGRITNAVRMILLAIVSFDDYINFTEYFKQLNERMPREKFVRLLKTTIEQTSALSAKLNELPEEAERLNRFGIHLTKCLAENDISPEDMPPLRLPRGAIISYDPILTIKEKTTRPGSTRVIGPRKTPSPSATRGKNL